MARDNDKRAINTDDIAIWGERLRTSASPLADVAAIDDLVEARLRGQH